MRSAGLGLPSARRALVLSVLLVAGRALSIPVDRTLSLSLGDPQFVRQNFVEAFEVDPPDLCQAEQMPSLEILLTPKRTGEGLFYLYEEGRLEVYRLVVQAPPARRGPGQAHEAAGLPAAPASGDGGLWKAARAACPELELREVDGEHFLHAHVSDDACRRALLSLLATQPVPADHLRLLFDVAALRAQLGDMEGRLHAAGLQGLTLVYAGATLTMKGTATPELRHRALKAIWPVAVGRLNVEDQTQPPGGGDH